MSAPVVVIDARELRPGATGVGRSLQGLLRAALPMARQFKFVLLTNHEQALHEFSKLDHVQILEVSNTPQQHPSGDLWLMFGLPRLLRQLGAKLYHGPSFILPPRNMSIPSIVTIHDLSLFDKHNYQSFGFCLYTRFMVQQALRHASHVITVSEVVRQQVISLFHYSADKISVVHNAIDDTYYRAASGKSETSYLLGIGTLEPRKNTVIIAKALQRIPHEIRPRLIWIGGSGYRSETIRREISSAIGAAFEWKQNATDEEVRQYLAGATALVCPSYNEGFSIPLLEAMAQNVPVIASDIAVHHEVASEAALYAKVNDADAWGDCIQRLMQSTDLRQKLIQNGREQLQKFSWQKSAERLLQVYKQMLHG